MQPNPMQPMQPANDEITAGQAAGRAADVQVVRGRPADEEVAALVAVLLSRAEGPAPADGDADGHDRPRPGWTGKPAYRPPGAWQSVQLARPLIRRAGVRAEPPEPPARRVVAVEVGGRRLDVSVPAD
jgi:hypothetical protein